MSMQDIVLLMSKVAFLEAQVAVLTKERDMWRDTDLRDASRIDELAEQLSAAQAVNEKLQTELSRMREFGSPASVLDLRRQRDELLAAAKTVVARWDTPLWKDVPATATFINELRAAIAKVKP